MTSTVTSPKQQAVSFSHVHLYVDKLKPLAHYKDLEGKLNELADQVLSQGLVTLAEKRSVWESLVIDSPWAGRSPENFTPHGRDVIEQLLAGFGFRVTAARMITRSSQVNTNTLLITSRDAQGVQFLVTALPSDDQITTPDDAMPFFDAGKVQTFFEAHANRPGIAVLAFTVDDVARILESYQQFHPNLVSDYYADYRILEVYAYYKPHGSSDGQDPLYRSPDPGTILRFVQKAQSADGTVINSLPLPGLVPVTAEFDALSKPAYCDHWVSNVFSRTEFLDILHDTLGFNPKVDFNAGVVAAGEAQIESTVTGNDSELETNDQLVALRDQSQVYLPINNALSSVGHVHGFLQELGQGVQHLASRVDDLVAFVQQGNENRLITGEGFTFLRIPRSYYGILAEGDFASENGNAGSGLVSQECAQAVMNGLREKSLMEKDGAIALEATREMIDGVLQSCLPDELLQEYLPTKDQVLEIIARSRYKNMHSLLKDHLKEETYLSIVRNQILVDIQGEDLLYQIFTANILQRNAGDEAPFLEFIQRVCSECVGEKGCPKKVRPGCGGFGIRNFLTLFLSIEVSKAMQEVTDATEAGDEERQAYAETMVQYFTDQLNEANPILTEISDAMTEEGLCKEQVIAAMQNNDTEEARAWQDKMEIAAARKQLGNDKLMACSARYNALMKALREKRNEAKQ